MWLTVEIRSPASRWFLPFFVLIVIEKEIPTKKIKRGLRVCVCVCAGLCVYV